MNEIRPGSIDHNQRRTAKPRINFSSAYARGGSINFSSISVSDFPVAGQPMPTPDRDPEGRGLLGHGVLATIHVPRRGERGSRAVGHVPQDGADAPGPRVS